MADLLCCLIAAIPSGNKTHPAAELEARARAGRKLQNLLQLTEQSGQDRKDALRSGRRAAVGAMMAYDARDLDVLRRASCG